MIIIEYVTMYPLGDAAIVVQLGNDIEFETHRKVQMLSAYLEGHAIPGVVEYVPTFTSVTIYYDILKVAAYYGISQKSPYELVYSLLEQLLRTIDGTEEYEAEEIEIPVCYGGEFGPDLEYVAEYNGIRPEEVINIHSEGKYLVYMIGFAPGFPYLGGLSERIATPRRETPRLTIPAGSIGIAGMQTGVYPIETPGGWQLIGKTPTRLFLPEQNPPTLLRAGNVIRFKPISRNEYEKLAEV